MKLFKAFFSDSAVETCVCCLQDINWYSFIGKHILFLAPSCIFNIGWFCSSHSTSPQTHSELYLKLGIGSTCVQKSQMTYVTKKLKYLEPKRKVVNLMITRMVKWTVHAATMQPASRLQYKLYDFVNFSKNKDESFES